MSSIKFNVTDVAKHSIGKFKVSNDFYIKGGEIKMFVSTTDTIPGYKIVKLLETIEARNNPFALTFNMAKNARQYLELHAEKLGANAIVGFASERNESRRKSGRASITYYVHGTAAIVEKDEGSRDTEVTQEDDVLKMLNLRYAKGEITKEEYEQMKKDIGVD